MADGYITVKQLIEALQELARLYGDDIPVVNSQFEPVVTADRVKVSGANGCIVR